MGGHGFYAEVFSGHNCFSMRRGVISNKQEPKQDSSGSEQARERALSTSLGGGSRVPAASGLALASPSSASLHRQSVLCSCCRMEGPHLPFSARPAFAFPRHIFLNSRQKAPPSSRKLCL